MASPSPSPPLSFDTMPASPLSSPSPLQQQQQQHGSDDGDALVHALEKLQCPDSTTTLHPEANNQDDDEEKDPRELSEPDAAESGLWPQRQHQQDPSLKKLESAHLKRANHALVQQIKDLVANYGRHVQSLQTQLQQQNASHTSAQREWQQQLEQLRSAQSEATDSARRAQAQVQVLEERLRQVEGLQYATSNTNSAPETEPQRAPTAPTLRLTHQHQGQPAPAGTAHHPHAVQRSVVNATAPRATSELQQVTRHPQLPSSDASTVRATRIGRNRSAPFGSVAAERPGEHQDHGYMTPPVNPFQWQNNESNPNGYSRYAMPAAPMSVRPSAYHPAQNFSSNDPQQQKPPSGYPQSPQQQLPTSPQPTTLISIRSFSDEDSDGEKKPSSGLLAYYSELLTSTLAPVASVASVASAMVAPTTSLNAKVTPAWQLFSNSAQLTKQSSLDVEQGFSPPRAHQSSLEQQYGYPLNPTSYPTYNNALQFQQHQSQSSNTSPASSPPPREQVASASPTHSRFGQL